jgi:hypothetical protein
MPLGEQKRNCRPCFTRICVLCLDYCSNMFSDKGIPFQEEFKIKNSHNRLFFHNFLINS